MAHSRRGDDARAGPVPHRLGLHRLALRSIRQLPARTRRSEQVRALAVAATDLGEFDKRVAKYATTLGGEPKGLCLCQDGTSLDRGTGFLLRGSNTPDQQGGVMLQLHCFVPVFDESTAKLQRILICERFVPLAK